MYEVKNGKQYINGKEVVDKAPDGWHKIIDAQTAPKGTDWYHNGSFFSKNHKSILVKNEHFNEFY